MKKNIVIAERIFPLYRKPVLDLIYKEKGIIFFHGEDKKSGIRQTKAEYSNLISSFYYGHRESRVFLFIFRKLIYARPKIVVHEFSAGIMSIPPLLFFCKLLNIKLIFWGHMYNRTKGFFPLKSFSDKYRLWLWRKADSLITYSQAEKQLLIDNKIKSEKIFVAFNTIDTHSFLKVRDELEKAGRTELKRQQKFIHEFNLVFIGRVYKEKKPELLLDLLIGLKEKGFESVAVHYIGDGEMVPFLKEKSKEAGLNNDVVFHGPIYDEFLTGAILFCSDLMVMPGCVGLSVNHAFCFNCPVVTFSEIDLEPAHGPEIEYIIDRKTGFLVTEHSSKALLQVAEEYFTSKELREKMKVEIKNFIENVCSVEKMAAGVIEAINYNSVK